MTVSQLDFPSDIPSGYRTLANEPAYDASLHLAPLDTSSVATESLADFGYSEGEISLCPSPIAVGGPFPLLSPAGVKAASEVLARLRSTAESDTGNRAPNYVAGGVYKSKFLRDMCSCPVLIQRFSEILGVKLAAHTIPHQQLYVNFAPEDITKAVDSWHTDSIDYDCVILLEDPASFEGGHFQYFRGTDKEAAEVFNTTPEDLPLGFSESLPVDRIVSVQKENAGDAVCQQGAKVVHRAEQLHKRAERTTIVISFVPAEVDCEDQNDLSRIHSWDHPGSAAELARHCAWRAESRLAAIRNLPINTPEDEVAKELESAIADVKKFLDILQKGQP